MSIAETIFGLLELTLLVHDNQPCSSTNILQFHISSTNSNNTTEELLETSGGDGLTVAGKKRRISTPNYCTFIDGDKGHVIF